MRMLLSMLMLAPGLLLARDAAEHTMISFDPARFADQRSALERAIGSEARYSELTARQRREVDRALDEIAGLVTGHDTVDALSPADKARLLTAQELVNTRLAGAADDSRLICSRERKVHSRLKTTRCQTVAERRRIAEASQQAIRHRTEVGNSAGPDPDPIRREW